MNDYACVLLCDLKIELSPTNKRKPDNNRLYTELAQREHRNLLYYLSSEHCDSTPQGVGPLRLLLSPCRHSVVRQQIAHTNNSHILQLSTARCSVSLEHNMIMRKDFFFPITMPALLQHLQKLLVPKHIVVDITTTSFVLAPRLFLGLGDACCSRSCGTYHFHMMSSII